MSRRASLSRRDALAVLGGTVATAGIGTASARSGPPTGDGPWRVTVGYAGPGGERAARDLAGGIVHEFAFDAVTVLLDADGVAALRARDDVRYAEYDGAYEIVEQKLPWGIDRVDADVVHGDGDTGVGIDVAIIDTGIDAGHPDLADNLGEGAAFQGGADTGQWQDDNGHGTHCAGIAAAIDNDTGVVGVAPSATLHAVKVVAAPGAGLSSDVAKGIEWVAEQGYDVGSLSIGGDHLESVADACEYAASQGVTLVAAAGNEGPCSDCVLYPAAYPEVIAVSGTDQEDRLAEKSSQGPEVDIAAPGQDIYSTYLGGYTTLSGTSMACPHVSGAAALLAAKGHSREAIRRRLGESAEDVGLSANESGAGLLDVATALGHDSGTEDEPASTDATTPTETPDASGSASAGGSGSGSAEVGDSSPSGTSQPSETATPASTETAGAGTPGRTDSPPGEATTSRSTPEPSSNGGIIDSVLGGIGDALRAVGRSLRKALGGDLG